MITTIQVNGFRSLRNFKMDIRRGLNVLVGPNGSGKTNIILFFEFLRLSVTKGVREAVSSMGGAGQVFRKRGKTKYGETIEISISGIVSNENIKYKYEVSFTAKASISEQEVYIERQNFKLMQLETGLSYMDIAWSWDGEKSDLAIEAFPESDNRGWWTRADFEKHVKADWFAQSPLVGYLQHFNEICSIVAWDLAGRFMLNVVPSAVKNPEDSTREPGIDSDGSGLSATLYAIKKNRPIPDTLRGSMRPSTQLKRASWSRVVSLIKIGVPTIEDIDVANEPFDNKLRVTITVGRGNQKMFLPLAAMSDGTVKWMSLVTRLATSNSALLLEEPENYLHPLMQSEVVRLLRESSQDGGFALISTHSETLINSLRVDELVIVNYHAGGTRAKRVTNADELAVEVQATGFGLGYYYLADAIRS